MHAFHKSELYCPVCRGYLPKEGFAKHLNIKHPANKLCLCSECGRTVKKENYRSHLKKSHPNLYAQLKRQSEVIKAKHSDGSLPRKKVADSDRKPGGHFFVQGGAPGLRKKR